MSFSPENQERPKLERNDVESLRFKFIWALASLGTALISNIYAAMLPIFYQDYLGLASKWITWASIIYAIWNAFNDPLFGFLSDSSRSTKGRRIPFMRYTAPFLGLTFLLVWFSPTGVADQEIFWWMLITMLLYDTCYTIIGLVYSALLPEVTEDDKKRGGLQQASSIAFLIGTILGFLLPDFFRPKQGESLMGFYVAMTIVAIVAAIMIIYTSYQVKERPEFTKVDEPLGFMESLRYTFKSKSFLILTGANFMAIFTQAILTGTMFYLADYVLQVASILPLIALFLGLLIGVLLSQILMNRLGVVETQQLLYGIGGISLVILTFAPDILIYGCLFFAGIGLAGPLVMNNILYGQVADEDELKSGVRREAMFFGTNALLTKPAQSVALALVPWLLELASFVTRDANGGEIYLDQPAEALTAIRLSLGLIPGLALIAGAILIQAYPIRKGYLLEIKTKLDALHIEKAQKLEQLENSNNPH